MDFDIPPMATVHAKYGLARIVGCGSAGIVLHVPQHEGKDEVLKVMYRYTDATLHEAVEAAEEEMQAGMAMHRACSLFVPARDVIKVPATDMPKKLDSMVRRLRNQADAGSPLPGTYCCMRMPWCGSSLGRRPFVGLDAACKVLRRLFFGVVQLHGAGQFHGDLKADNCVAMDDPATVRVIDHGLGGVSLEALVMSNLDLLPTGFKYPNYGPDISALMILATMAGMDDAKIAKVRALCALCTPGTPPGTPPPFGDVCKVLGISEAVVRTVLEPCGLEAVRRNMRDAVPTAAELEAAFVCIVQDWQQGTGSARKATIGAFGPGAGQRLDVHCLGVLLRWAVGHIEWSTPDGQAERNSVHQAFMDLANDMMAPNPFARPTAKQAYRRLLDIMSAL